MEPDQYIANLLLSKASVEFAGNSLCEEQIKGERSSREHYQKIRRRAYFCRAPKKAKALAAIMMGD